MHSLAGHENSLKPFSDQDQKTWREILAGHRQKRDRQIYGIFHEGLRALNLTENQVPDLTEINQILSRTTGWQGWVVRGLEDGQGFYRLLAQRKFPIGNFIRSAEDLSYTPEPDVVHDLYGHIPFFMNKKYADFCYQFGQAAKEFMDDSDLLRQFERFFWFTIEFGLIRTQEGIRIFGAGIASSLGECDYALSNQPEVVPFNIDTIRYQEFRIDEMQKRLFVLDSEDQLYSSLPELTRRARMDRDKKAKLA